MMTVNLIGSFVFTAHGYDILSCIYHNTGHNEPYPEAAKRKDSHSTSEDRSDMYSGIYTTVWLESTTEDTCELKITRLSNGTYELKWYDSKKEYYRGMGFLHNDELVGAFWQLP